MMIYRLNQFLAKAKKLIFQALVLVITNLSLRRNLSVSLKAAPSPSAVAVQGRLCHSCGFCKGIYYSYIIGNCNLCYRMDAVCNSKKENPHTVGSLERGAVGISRLRGSLSKAIKVVYKHKFQFVDPNQFLANAKKLIFPSKVLIITSLSLRRDLSVS